MMRVIDLKAVKNTITFSIYVLKEFFYQGNISFFLSLYIVSKDYDDHYIYVYLILQRISYVCNMRLSNKEKKRVDRSYLENLTLLNKLHIRQEKNCTSNSFIHQKFLNTYCDILNTFCRFLHAN